jgi:predicted ribosomally synthesized peptide with nif11-like leader
MAKQQIIQLFRAVQVNPTLREHLNTAPDIETLVDWANHQGYQFTIDEWRETTGFHVEELKCEMSEIPGI